MLAPFSLSLPPAPTATERRYHLLAAGFFLVVAAVFYWPGLGLLPRGIHEWAQADRLALAISFYDHGLNLFRPQTLNISSIDGVVGVEFPLMAYLTAVLATITGRDSIVVWFRLLGIGTAGLSYYFLFRLVFERCRNVVAALVPGVFLASSPVFAYYAGNFLPDPAGAALAVVGSYFFLRFAQRPQFSSLAWALGLYTLATLIKMSAGIYLVAAGGLALLWTYLQPTVFTLRQKLGLLALLGLGLGLVAGYVLYNRYLNEKYHSWLFLAQAMPFESKEQYENVLVRIRDTWKYEYFTKAHYTLLKISVFVCLLSSWRLLRTEWLWAGLLLLTVVGGRIFFQLMGRQFFDHDYYALAPYWPGLALLVALAAVQLASWRVAARPWQLGLQVSRYVLFGAVMVAMLGLGLQRYRARTTDPYPPFSDYYTYRWMPGGAAALAAAQIPASAQLLVVGEEPPNLTLVYFDRRGITWKPDLQQVIPQHFRDKLVENNLQYILMRQEIYQQLTSLQPSPLAELAVVIHNDRYTLLKLKTPAVQ